MGAVEDRIAVTAAGGEIAHPGSTERLMEYWVSGRGAAKIRWQAPCPFCRCLTQLRKATKGKLPPEELRGLCHNLEVRATGHRPNVENSRTKKCPC